MSTFFIDSLLIAEIQSSVMPLLYCFILLIVLLPLSGLITFQLIQIIKIDYQLNKLNTRLMSSGLNINEKLILAKIFIIKKLWFSSIKILETKNVQDVILKAKYMNYLGLSYYSMKQYDLSKNYYLKSLDCKKNDLVVLKNLAKVSELTNDFATALKTYKSILLYDPNNAVANRQLVKLQNRDSRI